MPKRESSPALRLDEDDECVISTAVDSVGTVRVDDGDGSVNCVPGSVAHAWRPTMYDDLECMVRVQRGRTDRPAVQQPPWSDCEPPRPGREGHPSPAVTVVEVPGDEVDTAALGAGAALVVGGWRWVVVGVGAVVAGAIGGGVVVVVVVVVAVSRSIGSSSSSTSNRHERTMAIER